MALPEEVLTGLKDLLRECCARVSQLNGGLPAGAAFFVSDTLLVTNRHVVGEHSGEGPHVLVHPYGAPAPLEGTVLPPSDLDPELDIALVRVAPDSGRPALLVHAAVSDGDCVIAGYPKENFYTELRPGSELSPPASGQLRLDNVTKEVQLLRLTGLQIRPGHSGGPVLHAPTGAVVAVTVFSEDPTTDLGGAALPLQRAFAGYPQLRAIAADAPVATRRHREILGRTGWEALGQVWNTKEQLDIHLTGTRSCWRISLRGQEEGPPRFARDLGDDMSEVIVQWARNSGRRDEPEVLLLGRLLSGALFSPEIAGQLPEAAKTDDDPVLVRLHLDPSGPLAELPWELATVPGDDTHFLSATEGYAFVRVNAALPSDPLAVEQPYASQPRARTGQASVLEIVVQPRDDPNRWPQVMEGGTPRPWPVSSDIVSQLEARLHAVQGPQQRLFQPEAPLVNPAFYDLKRRAEKGPVDVVHYVGFGYQEPEDDRRSPLERTWIALAGTSPDVMKAYRATEVLKELGRLRPQLLVMEFGTPRLDWPIGRYQPIGPALLGGVDLAHAEAMICTRPVHPLQYDRFNDLLYGLLGEGRTIEDAVQRARAALQAESPVDYAGFGWFAVTTGNRLRGRFFERPGSEGPGHRVPMSTGAGTTPPRGPQGASPGEGTSSDHRSTWGRD